MKIPGFIGVKGRTQAAPKLPEVGHVFGKGRFAVGVAQRLRAGEPAPDPCSVCVRPSVRHSPGQDRKHAKPRKVRKMRFSRNLVKFTKFSGI